MNDYIKPVATYAITVLMAHVAQRYHLNDQQTAAFMADLATGVGFVAAMFVHKQALNQEPPK